MPTNIFVNLPVKDLDKSKAFFASLGYSFNAQFTDDTAASMVVSDTIYVMLLTHDKFRQFTPRPIADASKSTEVLICLSMESKDNVNQMVDAALKAGGTEVGSATDHGFMYHRAYSDLDGHIWEVMWMDPKAVH